MPRPAEDFLLKITFTLFSDNGECELVEDYYWDDGDFSLAIEDCGLAQYYEENSDNWIGLN
jgi:hypothetical protein